MKLNLGKKMTVLILAALVLPGAWANAQDEQERFREAAEATQAQDFEKAVEILQELDKKIPDNPGIEFNLGYNLHAAGKIDEAIEYHKKASAAPQFKPTALYNLACAYSIKKDSDKAFDYLKQSIKAGFNESDQLNSDPDFDNIKSDARFKEMIAFMENGGKETAKKLKVEDFYGSWKVESGSRAGSKVESSRLPTITITKKHLTIPSDGESPEFVMAYKMDLDAKPMTVDFTIESDAFKGSKAQGIMKMDDDGMLSLCYEPTGEKRPKKFESTEENGCFVFKMKKAEERTEVKGKYADKAKALIGKWKCVAGKNGGNAIDAGNMDSTITFEEKMITIPQGEGKEFKMSYTLDASKSPMEIDMKIEKGPNGEAGDALGIIRMKSGKCQLCYDPMGATRPEKFESTEDNKFFLFEMESVKK